MRRHKKLKIARVSESDRRTIRVLRGLADFTAETFGTHGRKGHLGHTEMLLALGMAEDDIIPAPGVLEPLPFTQDNWESMEVRRSSNPSRPGHGMIQNTVHCRLTPKGRAAYERLKEVACEAF